MAMEIRMDTIKSVITQCVECIKVFNKCEPLTPG